ncbi:MAG: hypothetical protein C75L2_00280004 [Leptospirillum sp. Group II 'C75']|nr:MAG: conserved hypothetical protein [Leptospirillum rubarum]EIJ76507.1 MAG: hypothetical protein C75L2_00280004 [Leptospirillum sp. Group II 'C75']
MLTQGHPDFFGRRSEDDAVFRQEPPDLVDDRGPELKDLTADPVQALDVLFLFRLDRCKGHVWAYDRFANSQSIVEVVFVRLHERFHVLGRDQFHVMPHLLKLPSPVAGTPAGFHPDQARRQSHHTLLEFTPSCHFPEDLFPFFITSDQVKN